MKKKKGLLAAFLAVSLLAGYGTPAFAQEDIAVKGQYVYDAKSDKIISVDVSWTDMHFTYAATQENVWNPTNHTVSNKTNPSWVNNAASITVTNHSNASIIANLDYTKKAETVDGRFDKDELYLDDAAELSFNDYNHAPSETAKFTVSGSIENTGDRQDLGTIRVSIDEAVVLDLTNVSTDQYPTMIQNFVEENKVERLRMILKSTTIKKEQGAAIAEGCNEAGITKISILDGVLYAGQSAFAGWTEVESISLPTVTTVDNYAFKDCTSLKNVNLPKATTMATCAFQNCSSLKELSLPKVGYMGASNFSGSGIESLSFGTRFTNGYLPAEAFNGLDTTKVSLTLQKYQGDVNGHETKEGTDGTFNGSTFKTVTLEN